MIRFNPININAKSYPKPSIPILPVLSNSSLTLKKIGVSNLSNFFQHGIFYTNGRTALAKALSLSEVSKEYAVLMPAYHCGSMIEPALWLKADVLLYRINKDLKPDSDYIEQLISNSGKPVKVMLLTHYFGFSQDVWKWRKFCDHHDILLIEDCAHAFFGRHSDGTPVGTVGDYAIASVRKFFCTPDGGILIGKNLKSNAFSLQKKGLAKELYCLLGFIQQSVHYDRLGKLGSFIKFLDNWRSGLKSNLSGNSIETLAVKENRSTNSSWQWFIPDSLNKSGFYLSQWLLSHSNLKRILENRRKNYLALHAGIESIQHLEPLFQILPENVTPYMLPILLKSDESDFDRLKRSGIPIWRWEELAESDCKISRKYRLQLLHLPCHQELNSSEIKWILNTLGNILGKKT